MSPVRARSLALALLCAAPALARADGRAVALLPLEDLAGRPAVAQRLPSLLARELARRGYEVLHGPRVEAVLERLRVRYLDSLPAEALRALGEELGADGVVLGTLLSYREGGDPAVALSVRLVGRDGGRAWAGLVGLSSAETTGILGLGRIGTPEALVAEAVTRLLAGFPAVDARRPATRTLPRRRGRAPGPVAFRAAGFDPHRAGQICLMPLEGFAAQRSAPRVVAELAALRLGQREGLRVVEASELRRAMNAEGIRSFRDADSGRLRKVGRRLGTPLFLSGAVYAYRDPEAGDPEVDLQLTLVDVEAGRVLWTSRLGRRGSDYRGVLQRGAISTAPALADQVLAEMVDGLY